VNQPTFTHLHVHSHYSLLDGACRIEPLINQAKKKGMHSLAITDHGNLFGVIEFYTAAQEAGIKPILGMEAYMAPGHRTERESRGMAEASYHLLLLAMNHVGYQNLLKLATIGYCEGFYYRPRIDKQVLTDLSDGLICSSTCLGGEIPQALIKGDSERARQIAEQYLRIFGPDRFLIELQDHGMPEQRAINPELAELAQRLGIGCIVTNDVHYLEHDDAEAHDVLCCINTGARLEEEQRFRFPTDQFYLKSPEEMHQVFADFPDALATTEAVADLCTLDLDLGQRHPPVYQVPGNRSADERLRELVLEGAHQRYGEITAELAERIDYELSVIADKGFSSYFLIVWDFVQYARSEGIPCGARGSGCSSVVSYCLGISAPEPMRYGLFFERFMDPDRNEMPDMDIDICQEGRAKVIDYVRSKYGHVAQIITFNTLGAKAVIRDVCRVLGIPLQEADRFAKLIPSELHITIDRALEQEPELRNEYESNEELKRVLDIARRLEGLARHASVHAAGVVVADKPLQQFLPLYRSPDSDQIITQFDGPTVERVGLLKMDFLGLRTLTTLERARQLVKERHGIDVDLQAIDLTDPKVFELFATGQTKGIFQFESGGMRDVIMKMRPNRIEDLIAANALYRPGPMVNIEAYIGRKHGERWSTPHPVMTEVLEETFGIMVYQEQVSRVVHHLGGIELKRAFRLAKAISKKNREMIEVERDAFIAGCGANGVNPATANQIFDDIVRFGGYAFNKAHSTGYALVAFQTAHMKTYWPVEYMTALLTFEMNNTDKLVEYLDECKRMGMDLRPPSVNESQVDFSVQSPAEGSGADGIRFGLAGIKGLGRSAAEALVEGRNQVGSFRSLFHFSEVVDAQRVNRAAVEALIKAGAFDCTGATRKALMDVLPMALEAGGAVQRDKRSGQMSFFGDFDRSRSDDGRSSEPPLPDTEWSEAEMLAHEKSALGFYITKHPLASHAPLIEKYATANTVDLVNRPDGAEVTLGGIITRVRTMTTRNGRQPGARMAILTLEDLTGQVDAFVFPDLLAEHRKQIAPDRLVFLRGQVDRRREEPSLRVQNVVPLESADEHLAVGCVITMQSATTPADKLAELRALIERHAGHIPLYLQIQTNDRKLITLRPSGRAMAICATSDFQAAVEDLLGPGSIHLASPNRAAAPV
jgi:DNA polymerase-3 subunit alpha